MAHSTPTAVKNHGDAKRLSIALGAFIVELTLDRRVLAFYDEWRVRRRQTDQEFELLLVEHPDTIDMFIEQAFASDHEATAPFVRSLLHRLPESWTDMMTAELLRAFRTAHHEGRDARFGVAVELQPTHPRGKVPADPYNVQRGIRWLYRAYVPERPDAKRQLAREHAAYVNRHLEDCIRDVKDGIRQAWKLLDLGAASKWSPDVPGRIIVPGDPTK